MALKARRTGGGWGVLSGERFGRYGRRRPPFDREAVWVHAVSLGETRAAQPLVQAFLDRGLPVLLTHTTVTGRAEGARLFAEAIKRGQLAQAWLPYDFPGAVKRFVRYFRPSCGVLIEREVWPNLIHAATRDGVFMVLVSGRLSESSVRRSRWAVNVLRRAYGALDAVFAQTEADADRLRAVGAKAPRVMGNLKFDVSLSPAQLEAGRAWRRALGRPVVAVASTREGEDAWFTDILAAEVDLRSSALHMLIPRHPQRFPEAAALLQGRGLSFARRSQAGAALPADVDVLLGDTLGEMAFYYAAADVAIIGGGFASLGGQNLIEACAAGTPVIVGPHMFNFSQAVKDAVAAGVAIQVATPRDALREAEALLRDAPRREAMRAAALAWTATHAGATQRIVSALQPWLVGIGGRD